MDRTDEIEIQPLNGSHVHVVSKRSSPLCLKRGDNASETSSHLYDRGRSTKESSISEDLISDPHTIVECQPLNPNNSNATESGSRSSKKMKKSKSSSDSESDCKSPLTSGPILELKGREVVLAIVTIFLLSICGALAAILITSCPKNVKKDTQTKVNSVSDRPDKKENHDVCYSPSCLELAARTLRSLNESVDPCDDFWEYACGGWLSSHHIPSDENAWGVDDVLKDTIRQQSKEILDAPIQRKYDNSFERKVKLLHRKCMDLTDIEKEGVKPLKDIVASLGGWAVDSVDGDWTFDFMRTLRELQNTYWVDVLFTYWVAPDDKSSHNLVIQFDQSGLGMRLDSYNTSDRIKSYKEFLYTVISLWGVAEDDVQQHVDDIWNFEHNLAKIHIDMDDMMYDPGASYNNVTVRQLQQISPRISWLEFLKPNFTSVTSDTVVLITSKEHFADLSKLVEETDPKVLNKYMIWHLVMDFTQHISKPFRDAFATFDSFQSGSVKEDDRWEMCLKVVNEIMGMSIGALFVQEHFSEDSRDQVIEIVGGIRDNFGRTIENCSWIKEKTTSAAMEKLKALEYQIGYPEFLLNTSEVDKFYQHFHVSESDSYMDVHINSIYYELDTRVTSYRINSLPQSWEMNPQEVNAYYAFTENIMVFPAGILQSPYYNRDVPRYVNYGGIGSTIGHELLHAFDMFGSQYDKNGDLRMWWDFRDWTIFENKTMCIKNYLSDFTIHGIPLPGFQILAESTADIVGLQQSYQAYQTWAEKNGKEQRLPGIKFTNNQMFFLNFAQSWCTLRTEESMIEMLSTSHHAPAQIRVKGTLAQLPEFSDAFQCSKGSAMNVEKKCNVW